VRCDGGAQPPAERGQQPIADGRGKLVRYLRNCLMAKLGGEKTELLQISGDERARAVRTAALFSEEDLTRFLQVILRTFDELNYRQEPRLHLELGLMKLVHLQRLLPLEQILSGLPGAARPPATNKRPPATNQRPAQAIPLQAPRPAPSPVEPSSQGAGAFSVRAGSSTQAEHRRAGRETGGCASCRTGPEGSRA